MATASTNRNNTGFWSRRRLAWASAAAVVGCALTCSLPLLAVAAGGGIVASVAAFVLPWGEFGVGLVVFAGTLGVMALRRRLKGEPATTCCSTTAARPTRLFESPEPSADEPVVCTADLRDQPKVQRGIDSYRAAFAHLITTERFDGGFRWHFRREPGLEARLQQLIAAEHECCRFFQFELTTQGNEVIWETRAPGRAASVLEEFSRIPERLQAERRPGHDVAALKTKVHTAGLRFAADNDDDTALLGKSGQTT